MAPLCYAANFAIWQPWSHQMEFASVATTPLPEAESDSAAAATTEDGSAMRVASANVVSGTRKQLDGTNFFLHEETLTLS